MIPVPSGVRVWLAVGRTDMRRGMNGLSLQVQETLGRDPFAGDLFVFRGRRRRFTSFNIPIAVCGDRVSLASAAWQAIAGHQAIWAEGCRDDRCRGQARVEPRVARMDVLGFGLRVNERGATSACNRCAQ